MKIIISPAKKMKIDTDTMEYSNLPQFYEQAQQLQGVLKKKSYEELKWLWRCNDQIVKENVVRLDTLLLNHNLTPALLSYEGIQYQYMSPIIFSKNAWDYADRHLRILSAFYGLLKPFDGVIPYRLEMQAKLPIKEAKNLYEFWGQTIYDALVEDSDTIINLASAEYSKVIEPYITPDISYVTCVFGEVAEGRVKVKGTMAKMARGEMVRYLCENQIRQVRDIKNFDRQGYKYSASYSEHNYYVFLKGE